MSAVEAAERSAPLAMVPKESTPAVVREKVEPMRVARVLARPLVSALERMLVAPASLLMTDLLVPATAPEALPRRVWPL